MSEPNLRGEEGYVSKTSPLDVHETAARLAELARQRGMKVFGAFDQAAEARRVGLDLRETVVVLFGSPVAGTPVMEASPLAALDLPLKVVVWADGHETRVSYLSPAALAARHHLDPDLAAPLGGIDLLTDALVAPPATPPSSADEELIGPSR